MVNCIYILFTHINLIRIRTDIVEEIDEALDAIKDKSNVKKKKKARATGILKIPFLKSITIVTRLKGMHRKHLLPGFDDRSSDEAAIETLTTEITNVKTKPLSQCFSSQCICNRNFIA